MNDSIVIKSYGDKCPISDIYPTTLVNIEFKWWEHTCGECGLFWYRNKEGEGENLILDICACRKYDHDNFHATPHIRACPECVLIPKEADDV